MPQSYVVQCPCPERVSDLELSVPFEVLTTHRGNRILAAYDELMHSWCFADDLESFEHVANETTEFIVGPVRIKYSSVADPTEFPFVRNVTWIFEMRCVQYLEP